MIRVLTWNLRHGGGAGAMPRITMTLADHAPDLMVLTEVRRTTGGQIAAALMDLGWPHQIWTDPPARVNGLLIASRFPMAHRAGNPAAPGHPHRWIEAELEPFSVIGVHVPDDGKPRLRKEFWIALVEAARARANRPCLLIGDFNTGRHYLDEEGASFTCTAMLGTLASLGFVDAWRRLNPRRREYSWWSHESRGFRIDHAFVSSVLAGRISAAWYSHAEREQGLSDHSALVVTLSCGALRSDRPAVRVGVDRTAKPGLFGPL